jgi:hypothetical protein
MAIKHKPGLPHPARTIHGTRPKAFEQLRQDMARVLGADHPDTLRARHELARCTGEAGDVAEKHLKAPTL